MWTVVVSDQRGQVLAQHEWSEGSLTIGRDQSRSIVLPSKTASRKHARLDLVNGMPVIVDEGSANGTIVNGARIAGPTRLDDQSKVEVGEYRIALQRAAEDEGERTVLMRPKPAAAAPPPKPAAPPQFAPMPPPAPPTPRPAVPAMPPVSAGTPRPHGTGDVTSQFERHLQSVRSYREEAHATTLNKRARIDAEWTKTVQAMRSLQARLSADKRVMSFTISRDLKEIALKIADPHEKRGYRYFLLSRDHPDGKFPGIDNVWLREFGRDDASFDEPQKGVEELMLRIAGSLA